MRKRSEATRPLEAIQIDHAKVDVMIVDEATGREIGRPWITLGVDAFTRMATGFHLSLAPPTRLSASLCLLHSVCDKTLWLEQRGVDFSWPVAGLPEAIHLDSNSFFGRRAFVRACREAGIETVWSEPAGAGFGAHIEELVGNRLGHAPLIANVEPMERGERDLYVGSHVQRLTLRELESWIGGEIAGVYHCRKHRDLGRAPFTLWRKHMRSDLLRMPLDCVNFRMSLLPDDEGLLDEDGLHLLGRLYWSRAIADDLAAGRRRLEARYDPRDLSRIFVRRPSGRFVKARERRMFEPSREEDAHLIEPQGALAVATTSDLRIVETSRESTIAQSLMSPLCEEPPLRDVGFSEPSDAQLFVAGGAALCARKCVSACPFLFADR
ncbi:Mu transposase C-terminal domain-containing protein [Methylosinus sp. Ce-a6]|uniref:Mu transposase C-terminal domain-containing protein n=1 Tax=Methylosinus sp. Ce-a6 TaxID=2172005 RepID=UPI001359DDE8|nr:Mu transposase C-terminal domain-containing protein [Methylosinus sp. Ce-a6]